MQIIVILIKILALKYLIIRKCFKATVKFLTQVEICKSFRFSFYWKVGPKSNPLDFYQKVGRTYCRRTLCSFSELICKYRPTISWFNKEYKSKSDFRLWIVGVCLLNIHRRKKDDNVSELVVEPNRSFSSPPFHFSTSRISGNLMKTAQLTPFHCSWNKNLHEEQRKVS